MGRGACLHGAWRAAQLGGEDDCPLRRLRAKAVHPCAKVVRAKGRRSCKVVTGTWARNFVWGGLGCRNSTASDLRTLAARQPAQQLGPRRQSIEKKWRLLHWEQELGMTPRMHQP